MKPHFTDFVREADWETGAKVVVAVEAALIQKLLRKEQQVPPYRYFKYFVWISAALLLFSICCAESDYRRIAPLYNIKAFGRFQLSAGRPLHFKKF